MDNIRVYNMGYRDCKGWFAYIPPRHKKRITSHIKKKNKWRKKGHPLRIELSDCIEICKNRTLIHV